MTTDLAALSDEVLAADLRAARDAIDAAYWRFTRCRRASPPARELYVRRNALAAEVARRAATGRVA